VVPLVVRDVAELPFLPLSKTRICFEPCQGISIPATMICGQKEAKRVLISSGIHGGEFLGIAAAMQLAEELTPTEITGRVIILHPVNLPGFHAKVQHVNPEDGKNINHCFPGDANGSPSERKAAFIAETLRLHSDLFIDMHGGDIHEPLIPFAVYSNLNPATANLSRELAMATGIGMICAFNLESISVGCAANQGVPAIMVEFGHSGKWTPAEASQYGLYIRNALRHYGVLQGENLQVAPKEITDYHSMKANTMGCWYPSLKEGEMILKGSRIGEIRNYYGEILEVFEAERDCMIIYIVSSFGICPGDYLFATGVVQDSAAGSN